MTEENEGYDYAPFAKRETLFERTVRTARQNESVEPRAVELTGMRDVRLTCDELELVVLALGLLLVPAAAMLQVRLAALR